MRVCCGAIAVTIPAAVGGGDECIGGGIDEFNLFELLGRDCDAEGSICEPEP